MPVIRNGDEHGINVIVENHGGLSSNGEWLTGVIDMVEQGAAKQPVVVVTPALAGVTEALVAAMAIPPLRRSKLPAQWYGFDGTYRVRACGVDETGEVETHAAVLKMAEETAQKLMGS